MTDCQAASVILFVVGNIFRHLAWTMFGLVGCFLLASLFNIKIMPMEFMVKKYFKSLLYTLVAVQLLSGGFARAETDADPETAPDAMFDTGDEPVTEDVTVTVTRTGEGIKVVTPDGRRVLLRNDNTWEYIQVEQGLPSQSAVMEVANIKELRNACKVGLRLTNNLGYKIKSLVPSFSAYTSDGVLYETVSKSFSTIKPTRDQYRQIQFIGLRCQDIDHIVVSGAGHCSMGPMDKFNEAEGECLSHIYVQASDLISISK